MLSQIRTIFKTEQPVIIYPSAGTGAWEAALVNTLSPGDRVLMAETGWFATLWKKMAAKLGLEPEFIEGDWRSGVDARRVGERLAKDRQHQIKAVAVVHNETSTGVTSDISAVRRAIDQERHPALLFVDTISSLGSIDYRHDEWGVDVTVGGSQKGLMLPPGLGFNAVSKRAQSVNKASKFPRSFWDWNDMLAANNDGYFPYTPATNLLQGLRVAIDLLHGPKDLENVFARHQRAAEATRRAVSQWDLDVQCRIPSEYSSPLTAVRLPDGHSADRLRKEVSERYSVSWGNGLGGLADKVFRIGHLGDFNEPSILGTLSAIEMGLKVLGIPHKIGGVDAAMNFFWPAIRRLFQRLQNKIFGY